MRSLSWLCAVCIRLVLSSSVDWSNSESPLNGFYKVFCGQERLGPAVRDELSETDENNASRICKSLGELGSNLNNDKNVGLMWKLVVGLVKIKAKNLGEIPTELEKAAIKVAQPHSAAEEARLMLGLLNEVTVQQNKGSAGVTCETAAQYLDTPVRNGIDQQKVCPQLCTAVMFMNSIISETPAYAEGVEKYLVDNWGEDCMEDNKELIQENKRLVKLLMVFEAIPSQSEILFSVVSENQGDCHQTSRLFIEFGQQICMQLMAFEAALHSEGLEISAQKYISLQNAVASKGGLSKKYKDVLGEVLSLALGSTTRADLPFFVFGLIFFTENELGDDDYKDCSKRLKYLYRNERSRISAVIRKDWYGISGRARCFAFYLIDHRINSSQSAQQQDWDKHLVELASIKRREVDQLLESIIKTVTLSIVDPLSKVAKLLSVESAAESAENAEGIHPDMLDENEQIFREICWLGQQPTQIVYLKKLCPYLSILAKELINGGTDGIFQGDTVLPFFRDQRRVRTLEPLSIQYQDAVWEASYLIDLVTSQGAANRLYVGLLHLSRREGQVSQPGGNFDCSTAPSCLSLPSELIPQEPCSEAICWIVAMLERTQLDTACRNTAGITKVELIRQCAERKQLLETLLGLVALPVYGNQCAKLDMINELITPSLRNDGKSKPLYDKVRELCSGATQGELKVYQISDCLILERITVALSRPFQTFRVGQEMGMSELQRALARRQEKPTPSSQLDSRPPLERAISLLADELPLLATELASRTTSSGAAAEWTETFHDYLREVTALFDVGFVTYVDDATRLVLGLVHFARLARLHGESHGVTCAESAEIFEIPITKKDSDKCPGYCFVSYLISVHEKKNKKIASEADHISDYHQYSFSENCSSMKLVLSLTKLSLLKPYYQEPWVR